MSLEWLQANRFRNIHQTTIEFAPGLNLIFGENGSGKTTILECCHFLSSARSFRTPTLDPIVQRGEQHCLVRGQVNREGRLYQIGIERDRGGERDIHVNGEKVQRSSELARLLPTLLLGPESVELLLGAPVERRKFLNWALFHVEPGFVPLWEDANRCLRQRNQLLRDEAVDPRERRTWDERLADHADRIDQCRQNFMENYQPVFRHAVERLAGIPEVRLDYYRGWDRQGDLREVYRRDAESDINRGFTQRGFHRADVRITVSGQPAVKVCSRGELKALVWALVLAQGQVVNAQLHDQTLYLVDDLASEFDALHRQRVCQFLAETGAQVLLTGVDREVLLASCEGSFGRMFHVEHGSVSVRENN